MRPTAIDLEYVGDGHGGFVIDGQAPGHYSGRSVHSVGDLDGDGLGDLAVAARNADGNTGRIYVVHGQVGGEAIALSKLDLGSESSAGSMARPKPFSSAAFNGTCDGIHIPP